MPAIMSRLARLPGKVDFLTPTFRGFPRIVVAFPGTMGQQHARPGEEHNLTTHNTPWTFTRDHALVFLGYLTATAAAASTILLREAQPLVEVLLADVVATVIVFAFSLIFRNSSFYDPYWSVAPLLIALYFLMLPGQAVVARQVLVCALLSLWAVRLTGSWALCRHPNYLGEIGFWLSLFIFGIAAWGWVYPFSWAGPVVMIGLFLLVSIPMIERKLDADKPAYAAYRESTPMLLPRIR